MSSDIKLDGDNIIIEGKKLISKCHSIILDNEGRRKGSVKDERVALTHEDDKLILNWGNRYSGGVFINGVISAPDEKLKTNCHSIILDNKNRKEGAPKQGDDRVALTHGIGDELILNWDGRYSGGVTINGVISAPEGKLKTNCHSIILDNKNRKEGAPKQGEDRVALTHGVSDELILNWGGRYSGGVTINGVISAKTEPLEINGTLIVTGAPSSGQGGMAIVKKRKLEISSSNIKIFEDYPIYAGPGATEVKPPSAKVDLMDLVDRLEALENKIKEKNGQDNWRYCSQCKGLFYAGGPDKGVCPKGGEHIVKGSGNYVLKEDN